jgi:fatty acid desaturase
LDARSYHEFSALKTRVDKLNATFADLITWLEILTAAVGLTATVILWAMLGWRFGVTAAAALLFSFLVCTGKIDDPNSTTPDEDY